MIPVFTLLLIAMVLCRCFVPNLTDEDRNKVKNEREFLDKIENERLRHELGLRPTIHTLDQLASGAGTRALGSGALVRE